MSLEAGKLLVESQTEPSKLVEAKVVAEDAERVRATLALIVSYSQGVTDKDRENPQHYELVNIELPIP